MSTNHLLALLNSHIEGDEDQFLSIALQLAAQEARQGRSDEAEKLKRLVQKARDQQRAGKPAGGQTPIPLARPRGELQGLPGEGLPLDLWEDPFVPEELRMAKRILKTADMEPVDVLREMRYEGVARSALVLTTE